MRILHRISGTAAALFGRRRLDGDLDEELQAFFTASVDAKLAAGLSRDEAERAARIELGSRAAVKDWVNDVGWETKLEIVWHDLRYAARVLRRSPGFFAVAVITLALGTGANAAIFQLLDAIRFQPLPVERPHELVSIEVNRHGKPRIGMGFRRGIQTSTLWRELQSEQRAFAAMMAWSGDTWDLSTSGELTPANGLYVSGDYFDGLGITPHAGRLFTGSDDQQGCAAPGVVLSHALWQSRYGGDPRAIGQSITLNRRSFLILGVTPPGFAGVEVGRRFDAALPLCAEPLVRGARSVARRVDVWWLDVMGRLAPGWTIEQAAAHLAALSPGVFGATVPPSYNAESAGNYRAFTFTAVPAATGVSTLRTQYGAQLWLLFAGTALVLLITCANLASLMLARATARTREVAVRLAIGASRGRLLRQMLFESLLIAGAGVVAGSLIAGWLSRALVGLLSPDGTIFLDLAAGWRLFGFISTVVVLACVVFGLWPALRATADARPGTALQPGGRSGTDARATLGVRRTLVVAQVAISVVLVVAALLFARSLRNLGATDLGFDPEVLAAAVDLSRVGSADARPQVLDEIMARVRAVPGVRHASRALIVPLSGPEWNGKIALRGEVQPGLVYFNAIGTDFFRVLETPLLAGRAIDARDRPDTPRVAVVNEAFVKRFLPDGNPIGRTFELEGPSPRPVLEVIGVARNSKYRDVREEPLPIAYLAMAQDAGVPPLVEVLVRGDLPPATLRSGLTAAIAGVAPGAAVSYGSIDRNIRSLIRADRVMTSLALFFGGLALLIAVVGLYGVMSYMVTRRRVEIGIRMALGADRRRVRGMLLREAGVLLMAGGLAGVLLAVAVARYAAGLLFGVTPNDLPSFVLALATLGAVGLLASWLPARRASRLEPTIAIRDAD